MIMKAKMTLLVGGAVGYVLGTRAGRERYDQIMGQVQRLRQNPAVQQKASQAQDFAKGKAQEGQHKVADAASKAAGMAKEKVGAASEDSGSGQHAAQGDGPVTYPNASTPTGGLGG